MQVTAALPSGARRLDLKERRRQLACRYLESRQIEEFASTACTTFWSMCCVAHQCQHVYHVADERLFDEASGPYCSGSRRSRFAARSDIRVQPEEIVRIVLILQSHQLLILRRAVSVADAVLGSEVQIGSSGDVQGASRHRRHESRRCAASSLPVVASDPSGLEYSPRK